MDKVWAYLDAHPMLYPLVVFPAATAAVNVFQDLIKSRWPRLAGVLARAGFDPVGAVRKAMEKKP